MVVPSSISSSSQFFLGPKSTINAFDKNNILIYTPHLISIYTHSLLPDSSPSLKFKASISFDDYHNNTTNSKKILSISYLPSVNLIFVLFDNNSISAYNQSLVLQQNIKFQLIDSLPDDNTLPIFEKFKTQQNFISIYKVSSLLYLFHINNLLNPSYFRNSSTFTSNNTCLVSPSLNSFNELDLLKNSFIQSSQLAQNINSISSHLHPYLCKITDFGIVYCCLQNIYYLDFKSLILRESSSSSPSPSFITHIHQFNENTIFLSNSDYQIFYLSISFSSNILSINPILINKVSISIDNITSTNDYIFFSNNYTGLLIINKLNFQSPIYLRDKFQISFNKEINLFIAISHAFKINHNQTMSIFSDSRNSVISKPHCDIELKSSPLPAIISTNNNINFNIINYQFLGLHNNSPILKLNNNIIQSMNSSLPQIFQNINIDTIVSPNLIIYNDHIKLQNISIPLNDLVLYSHFNSFLLIFNKRTKNFSIFTNDKSYLNNPVNIPFQPTTIKIIKVNNKIIDFILFNDTNFATIRFNFNEKSLKLFNTFNWLTQYPILDIEPLNTITSQIFVILSAIGKILIINYTNDILYPTFETIPFLKFKSLFKINYKILALDSENNIHHVNYFDQHSDLNLIHSLNSNDEFISINPINDFLTILLTNNSIYQFTKSQSITNFETPIRGQINNYNFFDDDLTIVYTNLGLYFINNQDLKIKIFLNLKSITSVIINNDTISITVTNYDDLTNKISSLSYLLKYLKLENKFTNLININKNLFKDPTLFDPNSNLFFNQFQLLNIYDNRLNLIPLPEPYQKDYIYISKYQLICYISKFNNLIILEKKNGSCHQVKKFNNVSNVFLNNNNDNLLIYQAKKINLINLKDFNLINGLIIKPNLKILWVNKNILSIENNNQLSIKTGDFLIGLTSDLVYQEFKLN